MSVFASSRLLTPQGAARWSSSALTDRIFTERELRRYNGERGERAYIAYDGIVYDVTDCPKWRTGFHEQLHFAGFDLTRSLHKAPHTAEVFKRPCVKRVGMLKNEANWN